MAIKEIRKNYKAWLKSNDSKVYWIEREQNKTRRKELISQIRGEKDSSNTTSESGNTNSETFMSSEKQLDYDNSQS